MSDSRKNIFLTFDDGPNEPYTSQILDVLKKNQIKASFFVCGSNVERYPEAVRRIIGEGHAVGNHSFSHPFVLSFFGLLPKEIEKTEKIIMKVAGIKTVLFRSPWGLISFRPWLKSYLVRNNYRFVGWDVDSRDWMNPGSNKIIDRVFKKARENSIILLHDGKEARGNGDRSQTVTALPTIIEKLTARGYSFDKIT